MLSLSGNSGNLGKDGSCSKMSRMTGHCGLRSILEVATVGPVVE